MDERLKNFRRKAISDPSKGLNYLSALVKAGEIEDLIAFPFRKRTPEEEDIWEWNLMYPVPYEVGMTLEDVHTRLIEWCVRPDLVPSWYRARFGHIEDHLTSLIYPEPGVGMLFMQDPIPGQREAETRFEAMVRATDPASSLEEMCRSNVEADTTHVIILTKQILEFIYPLIRYQWNSLVEALNQSASGEMLLTDVSGWLNLYPILREYSVVEVVLGSEHFRWGPMDVVGI